ncbi:MAG TPA: transcription antitermination factor NusB [Acidimicrobiales bacterium]
MALTARQAAYQALRRIEHEGAFANLVLSRILDGTDERDRALATELVYGTTRMRRACDALVNRFVMREPDPEVRTLLRLGAYQVTFTAIPAHAAVSETVGLAHPKVRGFVNAVLRRVVSTPMVWPDDATRLSYPDWIVDRLTLELGRDDALATLARMNEPPPVTTRADGYVQDRSSQWVAELVEAEAGERVADLCAAPGGKATGLAAAGARVVATDRQHHRSRLVADNVERLASSDSQRGGTVYVVTADAASPPLRAGSFDRVLVDAPCSGLGALRRRADARWRVLPDDIDELAVLQARILAAARELVRPGGMLVYSVCTLTAAESIDHDAFGWPALAITDARWRPYGRGARVLPHDADTDGMTILRWGRPR